MLGEPNPKFREIASADGARIAIGNVLGMVEDGCIAFIEANTDDSCGVPRPEARRMRGLLSSPPRREALQSTIRGVVPFDDAGRPDWTEIERREGYLANVAVPCLLVWGHRDTLVPIGMGYKMVQQIPRAELVIVPQTKHFLPSWERPTVFAGLVRQFDAALKAGIATPVRRIRTISLPAER